MRLRQASSILRSWPGLVLEFIYRQTLAVALVNSTFMQSLVSFLGRLALFLSLYEEIFKLGLEEDFQHKAQISSVGIALHLPMASHRILVPCTYPPLSGSYRVSGKHFLHSPTTYRTLKTVFSGRQGRP